MPRDQQVINHSTYLMREDDVESQLFTQQSPVLQEFIWPRSPGLVELYVRERVGSFDATQQSIMLEPFAQVSFDTYFNSFYFDSRRIPSFPGPTFDAHGPKTY